MHSSGEGTQALASRVTQGVAVAIVVAGGTRLIFFAQQLVLARLLDEQAFGQYAYAMLVVGLPALLVNLRGAEAIIQSEAEGEELEALRDTAFTVQTGLALIFALGLVLARGWVAELAGKPYLMPLLGAMSLLLFTSTGGPSANTGPLMLPAALLERRLAFIPARLPELANVLVNLGVSVVLAVLGKGVWSLVWGFIAGTFVQAALLWVLARFRPRLRIVPAALARYLRFGWPLYLSYVLSWGYLNADYFFVGQWLGEEQLGLYYMAFNISQMPLQARFILSRVALPAFARARKDAALLQRAYHFVMRYAFALAGVVCAPGIALAYPGLVFLLGPRWAPAAPVLQVLFFSTWIRVGCGFNGELLTGLGKTGAVLLSTAGALITLLVLGPPMLRTWGIVGMAGAAALSSFATALISSMIIRAAIGARFARHILPAGVSMAVVAGVGLAGAPLVHNVGGLVAVAAGLVLLYAGLYIGLFDRSLLEKARKRLRP